MNQQDFIDSMEELHARFNTVAASLNLGDTGDESAANPSTLASLRLVERYIQNEGLFSPNEDFNELDLGLIKFLRLPYLIAVVLSKQPGPGRTANLKEAERYYTVFLELLDHYRILPKSIVAVLKEFTKNSAGFRIQREAKIELYKEEKAQTEAYEVARSKDDARETMLLYLLKTAYEGLNALLFIPQELEILKFKNKLETDESARQEYEQQRAQPPGKLSYFKIDSKQPQDGPTIQSGDIKGLPNEPNSNSLPIVEDFQNNPTNKLLNQRQEILGRLNQHSYAQPTMTLDEFDELEYRLLKEKEKAGKDAARHRKEELARLGIEDSEDSDNEIVSDAKRLKDRNWDDWKDANEKGSGNRGNR